MGTDIAAGCDVDPKMKGEKVREMARDGVMIRRDWRSR